MTRRFLALVLVLAAAAVVGCNRSQEPGTISDPGADTPQDNAGGGTASAGDPTQHEGSHDTRTSQSSQPGSAPARPGAIPAPADVGAPPADAQRTASGLASKVLRAGTGTEHPSARDRVTVHYTGWTTDGAMFDSSITRGEPATFPLSGVIPGWTEGVQLMTVGEKRRFWIPEDLAYHGRPGAPAGMLVFDVELISVQAVPAPAPAPAAPPDVAAAPRNAQRTASGLASRVLRPGTGTRHPAATNTVQVHYTGWTTDGNMFDSSVTRGEPASFPLNRVIAGWTEGVQLMVEGEKRRFWIPESLAYQGRPGAPAGMLVFDVELLHIVN